MLPNGQNLNNGDHTEKVFVDREQLKRRACTNLPVIQVDIREGRSREQIREFQKALTEAAVKTIGAPREYVYVIIREQPGPNHCLAGKPLIEWKPSEKAG